MSITAFAVAINLYYGRRGFMPLDHSVVFDGGWRTLMGQVPFRDYVTPNAITPSLIQGALFWIFSVTWFTFVLHAALFNALFALLVYWLVRLCGGSSLGALPYALFSSVVFYPPIGVAFHDQHAFFFTLLAIVIALAGRKSTRDWVGHSSLLLSPIALGLSFLSKQTPALLGVAIVIVIALTYRDPWRASLAVGGGITGVLAMAILVAVLLRLDFDLIRTYFFELPTSTAEQRSGGLLAGDGVFAVRPRIFTPLVVVLGAPLALGMALRLRVSRQRFRTLAGYLALSLSLVLVCDIFVRVTLNQPEHGVPLVFASLGILHAAIAETVGRRSLVALAVGMALVLSGTFDAWRFNARVNAERTAVDMVFDRHSYQDDLPPQLSFLEWDVPEEWSRHSPRELSNIVGRLTRGPGNFLLIGESSILYGLSRRPSVFPALYFVDGLTVPARGSPDRAVFERMLLDAMGRYGVRRVVVERTRSSFTPEVDDFPDLRELIARCSSGPPERTLAFIVIELGRCGATSDSDR